MGKILRVQFQKDKVISVGTQELVGVYECQGCSETYKTEKGQEDIPPVCPKCADEADMLLLGLAAD